MAQGNFRRRGSSPLPNHSRTSRALLPAARFLALAFPVRHRSFPEEKPGQRPPQWGGPDKQGSPPDRDHRREGHSRPRLHSPNPDQAQNRPNPSLLPNRRASHLPSHRATHRLSSRRANHLHASRHRASRHRANHLHASHHRANHPRRASRRPPNPPDGILLPWHRHLSLRHHDRPRHHGPRTIRSRGTRRRPTPTPRQPVPFSFGQHSCRFSRDE